MGWWWLEERNNCGRAPAFRAGIRPLPLSPTFANVLISAPSCQCLSPPIPPSFSLSVPLDFEIDCASQPSNALRASDFESTGAIRTPSKKNHENVRARGLNSMTSKRADTSIPMDVQVPPSTPHRHHISLIRFECFLGSWVYNPWA